jgi:signal transduction histidine kinase
MRLAEFILTEMEAVLAEWEAFAITLLPAARHMESAALRDHAQQILEAVAQDLSSPQTYEAQSEKSRGRAFRAIDAPETAAQTHAILRARSGFDINQLAAEYRALRATVLRLWMDKFESTPAQLDDVIRFNEAIDQALAESISFFTLQVEQARNLLLGMLGHDMRSPLQTIQMTAFHLARLNAGDEVVGAASRLIRSGARMQALLNDMLDFNRTRLGLGISIDPAPADLANLAADELDQLRAAHADHEVSLAVHGSCQGVWDGRRLQQLLGNLVGNAFKYGTPGCPVSVEMTGDASGVLLEVRNHGPAIEPAALERIFEPLERGPDANIRTQSRDSLGLGLYIAREIARAHGGEISVRSNESETVFAVRLPPRASHVSQ